MENELNRSDDRVTDEYRSEATMGDDEKRSDGKLIEIDRCSTEEGRSATRNCVLGVFGMRLVNCAVLLSKDQAHSEMGTS